MRIIFLTTAALLALSLTGCGNKPREAIGNADKLYGLADITVECFLSKRNRTSHPAKEPPG